MKKILNILGILFVTFYSAQTNLTSTENYIYSKTCLNDDCSKKSEGVQYFDSWGKPIQVIDIKGSPTGKDIVGHIEYDQFGRQVKDYLPVPQSGTLNGAIVPTPLANASSVYGSEKIYAEKTLENSPLDRIQQQIQVGNAWSNKPIAFQYDTNITNEVYKFTTTTTWVNNATSSALVLEYFPPNQLYKNTVTDEDGNSTIEFKNRQGQVIMVRKNDGTYYTDTYYVYNEYNQLAFVIPPKALQGPITETVLNDLCYQYRYDGWNRQVEKKLPGKGWEYIVYDKVDRILMTQDSNLKAKNQWLVTKHDQFNRVVYTGITNNPASRIDLQVYINNSGGSPINHEQRTVSPFTVSGMNVYYSNVVSPSVIDVLLSINYYDTYPIGSPTVTNVFAQELLTDNPANSRTTMGMLTASYVKNIEDDNWTKNFIWYDTKGRNIGSRSNNHLGGYTKTESEFDFAGLTKQTKVYHKRLDTDTEKVITQTFSYDSQNRLLVHKHKVDSNPEEILAQNEYDELSQLKIKKVGGANPSSPLQIINYSYNIKGWLTKINDPANLNGKLFGYEIKYNNPVYTNIAGGKYNGNITEIDWNTSTVNNLKRYNYTYDKLNRLTDAEYAEPNTTNPHNKNFDERLTYDLNGNIASLKRNAFPVSGTTSTTVDNLVYQYTGNRLNKVTENALNDTGYEGGNNMIDYDLNGNMINMKDKGIQSIAYNFLNLPNSIGIQHVNPIGNISTTGISHLYRADGAKLRKTYVQQAYMGLPTTRMTDYLDGFQYSYEDDGGICITCRTESAYEIQAYSKIVSPIITKASWKLDFVPTSEGFYSFAENRYIYNYKDHLGNVRVSFGKNNAGALQVMDTNNYYPFGLNHIGGSSSSNFGSYYNYKYNGKELQETGMYDFGARMYMPDLGRWGVVDALAEQMRRYSPYNYAFNNPIRFIDPDGNSPRDTYGDHSAFNGDFDPNTSLSGYNGMGGSHGMYFANNDGGGFASGKNTEIFGQTQAYRDLMAGRTNSITSSNGYLLYWTGAMSSSGSLINGEPNVELELGVAHRQFVGDGPAWDAYKNMADWSSVVAQDGFKYAAKRRTNLYNNGYWMDNLGNMRSVAYAGRAVDSQIGLRSSYLRTTAMYGKYAKRAGYVGYAISAGQIGYGVYEDNGKFGKNAQVATAGVAGGMAGAAIGGWAGTKSGTLIGAAIGVWFEGVGAIPAGAVGGIVGGIAGSILGGVYGGDYAEKRAEEWLK